MQPPAPNPLDLLAASTRKAAFLADAVTALAECRGRYDLSPCGLAGLAEYLLDLEISLSAVETTLNRQEA